jgi:hypothetical protein
MHFPRFPNEGSVTFFFFFFGDPLDLLMGLLGRCTVDLDLGMGIAL